MAAPAGGAVAEIEEARKRLPALALNADASLEARQTAQWEDYDNDAGQLRLKFKPASESREAPPLAGKPVEMAGLADAETIGFAVTSLASDARGVAELKREVENRRQVRDALQSQLSQERLAMGVAQAGAVEVTSAAYDPYFIQTELEKIQSKEVLDEVVDKLGLDGDWARADAVSGRLTPEQEAVAQGVDVLQRMLLGQEQELARAEQQLREAEERAQPVAPELEPPAPVEPKAPPPVPQPEVSTSVNPFSTFSLNVSDVSFKLAQASLGQGQLPDPASIRSEEFINAFEYHDPEPSPGRRVGVAWERSRYPFAHNRDLLRFGVQTAAQGREASRPLNVVLCLDNSGSMERADRVAILREALRVLGGQLQDEDRISVVAFARTARLWMDGFSGAEARDLPERLGQLNPEGGTNLEDALKLAYATARRHFVPSGVNRVVLLTDGAANLGNLDPAALRESVIEQRKDGIALDSFGVGWEGYNDDLLETLSRNGDGRYGFLNTPEEAATEFADQLAGALRVAASDVKVQVEFNPRRVRTYRQVGYAKHQLTKEQFRDNTVDAAEIGAAESGHALYVIETDPNGVGPVAVVRVRFKVPETGEVEENEWLIPYEGPALDLTAASPAIRLAAVASAFSEWLAGHPYAAEVSPPRLLELLRGVPEVYELDPRPKQLEWMIREAGSIAGQ
jgi:Mg-chelatase subunit ChlD